MNQERFIDYYEILQVSPSADPETIERVFRLLAKRYHPDNGRTGNSEKFGVIVEAYRVVSNPEKRAAYDATYESRRQEEWSLFLETPMSGVDEDRRVRFRTGDPAQNIRFLDGFRELCARGLVMHHLFPEFSLTRTGYEFAATIRREEVQ